MSELLSDGFVHLRRYAEDDVNEVYEAVRESIAELSPWLAWCDVNYSRAEAREFIQDQKRWWEQGRVYNFAVTDEQTGKYLGGCLLNNINRENSLANLAYWVRSSCTNRGVATAAAKLVARYGFTRLGLNRVEIVMAKENTASARVAEKAGARFEGELRKRVVVRDKVYDAWLYALLAEDVDISSD